MIECSFGAAQTVERNGPVIEMELGDRAVSALYEENAGSIYHRINVVRGRAMDAVFARVLDDDAETTTE